MISTQAIEFNSIPSIRALVPGGYEAMKLAVDIAVPEAYHGAVDVDAVEAVFPYGAVDLRLQPGGAEFSSGIAIPAMGDRGDALAPPRPAKVPAAGLRKRPL